MSDLQKIRGAALEKAVRQAPAAVIIVEAASGEIILANEEAKAMMRRILTGSMPSRLEDFRDLRDAGDFELYRPNGDAYEPEEWALMRSIRTGEEVSAQEYDYVAADGTWGTLRCDASPIHDDGRVVAGVLLVRDVTERKQAVEKQERLAKIVQNSSDFIGICDLDWQVSYVNEAGQKLVGLGGIEEARRTRVPDYFVPEDRAFVADDMFAAVMEEGRWTGELNLRHFETDEQIPVSWDVFRIDDPTTGDPFSIATIARDISSRNRDEEALRGSKRRTENILESITEDFITVDREWRLTYASERALGTMRKTKGEELTREGFLGNSIWELYPELVGSTLYQKYHEALREHKTVEFEAYFSTSDAWYEVHAYPSEEGLSIYSQDITERKRAEEQLAYHAGLLENIHDAVLATDARFVLTAWNKGAERMFGWTADEALGRSVTEVVPRDYGDEQLGQEPEELTETGRWHGERTWYRKDGAPVQAEGITVALPGGQDETTGYLCIIRDTSERKEAEQRFRATFEQAAVGMSHTAPDGTLLRVNRKLCEVLGYTPEEMLGMKIQSRTHPDDLDKDVEQAGRLIAGEIEAYSMEKRLFRKDDSVLWINLTVSLVRDASGEPDYLIAVCEDIDERKRAEEALKESERQRRFVLGAVGLGSWRLDPATRHLESSEACKRNFGLPPDADLPFERFLSMLHPDDRGSVLGAIEESIATGTAYEADYRVVAPGGEVRWVAARGRTVHTPDGEPPNLAGVTLDITKSKRDEERLLESSRRTEDILESVTDAFYALDHEWRLTYLNERALRFASQLAGEEFTLDGLIGRTLWETLPAIVGTSIEDEYRRAVRERRTAVFEYPYPGGGPIFEVHAYPSEQGLSIYFQDVTERKRTEEAVRARTRQQAVVADLGLRALANDGVGSLLDDTVALVARTLDVECCRVVEILPGGEELLLRAGFGWQEGVVGSTAKIDPQVAYTLSSSGPVMFEDLEAETRFEPSPMLRARGVVSGMTVLIPGRVEPYGALGAHTLTRRTFSEEDANFLQAVANVLATAIERERTDRELGEAREVERSRIARDLHDEALQDLAYAMTQAQMVRAAPAGEETANRSVRLAAALKRVEQQLRGAIYDLRLEAEHDKPFSELLDSLVELHRTMAPDIEIDLDLRDGVLQGPLGTPGRETLRIVGEALTNARRHSGARNVRVSVSTSGGRLLAEVSDDGRGTGPSREPSSDGGMGIKGMRERARVLGGELRIQSEPTMGTKVIFEMALERERKRPESDVRVLLVDDHAAVREAIGAAFEREAGFEVAGQAGSLAEARRVLAERGPVDVAVVDLGLPDGNGADLIEDLRAANPEAQALVLSASLDRAETARAVQSGAAGVLHKTAHLDEVVGAVERLRAGETLMPLEEVVELLRFAGTRKDEEHEARQAIESLTPREMEVLQKLAEGLGSEGIAERLHISVRTQRNHMASILAKLGVHSQLQALIFAVRHGAVKIS